MTLVLETSSDIHPESNDSIKQSLLRFGLNTIGEPLIFGSRAALCTICLHHPSRMETHK